MEKRTLGKSGVKVSRIGFGVLPMGASQMDLSVEEGSSLIEYALELGIDFFDTAQYYDTYRFLAPALKRSRREAVISSKCLYPDARSVREAIEQARRELDRDVIDIFLLHEVRGPEDFIRRSGAWEALLEAREKGIIRAAGVSTHHQDVCGYMAGVKECDVVFPLINKDGLGIRLKDGPGSAAGMISAIDQCHKAGKGVFAMKVFGGGNLTGEYRDCLDFVNGIDGVSSMVIGFTKREEILRAVQYGEGRLDPSYAPDITMKKMHICKDDCMGCGSCMERCPNNAISVSEKDGLMEIDHDICLTCGYCAPVCPMRAIIMY